MDEACLGRWLTLTDVAAHSGRKIDAVRAWGQRRRRERRHTWRKNNGGEWTVEVTAEVLSDLASGGVLGDVAEVLGHVEDAATTREELAQMREALTEARIGHARLEERLVAAEMMAVGLRADIERQRIEAERERARGDRLEAQLAEARKPALLRLLEALRRR